MESIYWNNLLEGYAVEIIKCVYGIGAYDDVCAAVTERYVTIRNFLIVQRTIYDDGTILRVDRDGRRRLNLCSSIYLRTFDHFKANNTSLQDIPFLHRINDLKTEIYSSFLLNQSNAPRCEMENSQQFGSASTSKVFGIKSWKQLSKNRFINCKLLYWMVLPFFEAHLALLVLS